MNISDTHFTLGVFIGLPIAGLFIFGFLLAGGWLRKISEDADDFDRGPLKALGWGFTALGVFIILCVVGGYFPYGNQYHQFQPKYGTVTSIDKRLVSSSSSSMEEKYVVTFEGSKQQYACMDTRCATIEVGDDLSLSCIREFEYSATDGWDCRYVDWEEKA